MRIAVVHSDLLRDVPESAHKSLKLSLPVPPSVNKLYTNVFKGGRPTGGKRLSSQAERYMHSSRALLEDAIDSQKWQCSDKGIWLYADMVFYFQDRRIRDSHNCLKLLLDVMQGVVYQNDYYVLPRIQSVEYDKEHPRVEVRISPQSELSRQKRI